MIPCRVGSAVVLRIAAIDCCCPASVRASVARCTVRQGSPAQGAGVWRTFLPGFLKTGALFRQDNVDSRMPFHSSTHMKVDFTRPRLLYWGLCSTMLKGSPADSLRR
jgi:hypothetical protein